MRADLGWSYFTAGAMNTVNAAGYLAGAIAAFTSVFAFGQIVGPSLIGALSDATGGLRVGFAASAAILAAASLVALMQRPVRASPG